MFLLLAHLQAGQVGVPQLQVVLVPEVLSHSSLHSLPVLQLQGEPAKQQPVLLRVGGNFSCELAAASAACKMCGAVDVRLQAGRAARHVAHSVLPAHAATVGHLHLQTWDQEHQKVLTQTELVGLKGCMKCVSITCLSVNMWPNEGYGMFWVKLTSSFGKGRHVNITRRTRRQNDWGQRSLISENSLCVCAYTNH